MAIIGSSAVETGTTHPWEKAQLILYGGSYSPSVAEEVYEIKIRHSSTTNLGIKLDAGIYDAADLTLQSHEILTCTDDRNQWVTYTLTTPWPLDPAKSYYIGFKTDKDMHTNQSSWHTSSCYEITNYNTVVLPATFYNGNGWQHFEPAFYGTTRVATVAASIVPSIIQQYFNQRN